MGTRAIFMRSLRKKLRDQTWRSSRAALAATSARELFHFFYLVLLEILHGFALLVAVHGVALHEHFEVDLGGVEFGPVDAGELALLAEQDAAAAAHARAVNHDGVEADHGLDAERRGKACNGAHHGHGADGENEIEFAAVSENGFELVGDQALFTVGAVVSENVGLV